jgi:hypothetical protein
VFEASSWDGAFPGSLHWHAGRRQVWLGEPVRARLAPGGGPTVHPERVPRDTASTLVESSKRFLHFLERRMGNRANAEDLLQMACLKFAERGDSLRDQEKPVPWFYKLLRSRAFPGRGTSSRRP